MPSQPIHFMGSQQVSLAAALDMPEGTPRAFALFANCFTCTKDVYVASRVAKELKARGIAVLRMDFTGLGESEGDFSYTNFSSNVADIKIAAQWLNENYQTPQLLIGHSLGGAAMLVAAPQIKGVKLVATIAAPADPAHVAHHFAKAHAEIKQQGKADVLLAGRPFTIRQQFMDDIASHTLEESVARLHAALLVFHSPIDSTVGIENAGKIFAAAKHPKSFITLGTSDHMISKREDTIYIAEIISAWVARYCATT